MQCEAHEILKEELTRVKNDIGEIYSLDREREKVMSEIQSNITELNTKQEIMNKDIMALKDGQQDLDTKVTSLDHKITTIDQTTKIMQSDLKELKANIAQKKWQPKDICVIVAAVFAFLGTLATAAATFYR